MDDCIFCKIVRHEILAQIVYEDDDVVAFKDLNPVAPVHILVIPKKHISELKAISDEDRELMGKLMVVIGKLARENSTDDEGFRLVVNQGEQAGQSVFHLHFHLMGGRSFGWPPG